MDDRHNLSQFGSLGLKEHRLSFEDLLVAGDEIANWEALSVWCDFPMSSEKMLKFTEERWPEVLPRLKGLKALTITTRLNQAFFDIICQITNLNALFIFGSSSENISAVSRLSELQRLRLDSFTQLTDLLPLTSLNHLTTLSIENSFKIENYEVIGEINSLVGLLLSGDTFAPKKLQLKSLKPFTQLKNLRHLDLSTTSIIDKSYECILEMEKLERLDLLSKMPKATRDKIKSKHHNLRAGFFVDYDFENKRFYEGKNW